MVNMNELDLVPNNDGQHFVDDKENQRSLAGRTKTAMPPRGAKDVARRKSKDVKGLNYLTPSTDLPSALQK